MNGIKFIAFLAYLKGESAGRANVVEIEVLKLAFVILSAALKIHYLIKNPQQ